MKNEFLELGEQPDDNNEANASSNDAVFARVGVFFDRVESCEQTCPEDQVADSLHDQSSGIVAMYTMEKAMDPMLRGMNTSIEVKIGAHCLGGKRKLLGGFKCALQTTCELTADSKQPGYEEEV